MGAALSPSVSPPGPCAGTETSLLEQGGAQILCLPYWWESGSLCQHGSFSIRVTLGTPPHRHLRALSVFNECHYHGCCKLLSEKGGEAGEGQIQEGPYTGSQIPETPLND